MLLLPGLGICFNTLKRPFNSLVSLYSGWNLHSQCNIYLTGILKHNRTFSSLFPKLEFCQNQCECYVCKKHFSLAKKSAVNAISTEIVNSINSPILRLGDYDCLGFDLDNTLCEYNISSSVAMEYDVLAKFLVKEKGYDPYYLLNPLDKDSIDFMQKGLIVDFARGNLLKIGETGIICKASHGTRFLTEKEIENAYGKGKSWEVTSEFCSNLLVAWNSPLSDRMRALLDYFDMPASLAFGRIIDSVDHKLGRPADIYNVWPDVLAGLHNMYNRENFDSCEEGYFQAIKANPEKFIKKCNPLVLEWLKKMKESKVTFLITGSNCDFASFTAETCLGTDWRSLFDVVVCYARKPGFFYGCRPFIKLDKFKEKNPLDVNDLEFGNIYNQGNWQELYQLFKRKLCKKEPRCLYFGDNLIQDVYTPSKYTKCESVAVVEELSVSNPYGDSKGHPSKEILSSHSWGSYFFDKHGQMNTVWGGVINNYSKVCVPSLCCCTELN